MVGHRPRAHQTRRRRPAGGGARSGIAGRRRVSTNHGSVAYTSKAYVDLCKRLKITQPMGRSSRLSTNSVTESFNSTPKRELLEGRSTFPNQATAYRGRVPVCQPVQHSKATLRKDRPHQPERLRDSRLRYSPGSGITQNDTVSTSRGQGLDLSGCSRRRRQQAVVELGLLAVSSDTTCDLSVHGILLPKVRSYEGVTQ